MKLRLLLLFCLLLKSISSFSQSANPFNQFYQYGIADAFIGGLYKGTLTLNELKQHGNFGLGAPDLLDGELIVLDGKVYQTKANGETFEPNNKVTTSLSFVTFFKADTSFVINSQLSEQSASAYILNLLKNKNRMYAIKITGTFDKVKTRAFPPFKQEPFPPLSSILDQQQFFNFQNIEGTLVGFYLPSYLNGVSIAGLHFHFLSSDKKHGGHILNYSGSNFKIEIAQLKSFHLEEQRDPALQNFQFKKTANESLEKVEKGH
ncbi:acetolactate decarboxylase [Solitalea sp. MAHUQ-68]|uniref:Alpha-acetolactate decarboxylase n=1 Tax=Solitalea agri TaxID=2953739 RepID=A0A9X2JBI6_9SPHI|nr:acetolactate decarboxylase [Solitalea agri]MCO4291489.1 acetolactate decarboxylase [Solitalea agri]